MQVRIMLLCLFCMSVSGTVTVANAQSIVSDSEKQKQWKSMENGPWDFAADWYYFFLHKKYSGAEMYWKWDWFNSGFRVRFKEPKSDVKRIMPVRVTAEETQRQKIKKVESERKYIEELYKEELAREADRNVDLMYATYKDEFNRMQDCITDGLLYCMQKSDGKLRYQVDELSRQNEILCADIAYIQVSVCMRISWRVSERMSLKVSSLQGLIIKYRTMDRILSEKSKSLAFTGHRTIPVERQNEIRARLVEAVSVACKSGITCFYSGMAMGFDLLAAETVLSLKGRYPDIRLIAVVPFRRQSCRWPSMEKERYQKIISQADQVIILSEHYFKGCLLRRNDFMLEHSCGVIAFYDGKPYGGTFYTCREAVKKGMDIVNLY